jgi:nucleoside-diphosphate-sugar epimerase
LNQLFKNILVTGGAGYVGSLLIPQLLNSGYHVTVYDCLFFGKAHLPADHPELVIVDGDIRDTAKLAKAMVGQDAVLHLACISNDPSFELDEGLSKGINFDCFESIVTTSKEAGVKRFVYASSSSVYGVSDAPEVTEDHPLVPLTLYNRFKGECEPILFQHQSPDFTCVTIRPATVCGYAPRCRLDLTVNILTNHAITNGKITVFGGEQKRPNLHVEDMCDVYEVMLDAPAEKIAGEIFNIGYENFTVMEIAQFVQGVVSEEFPELGKVDIVVTESDDKRSYHINSDKIKRVLGFAPKRNIEDAARSICAAFKDGRLPDSMTNDNYFNVRKMKTLTVA